MVVRGGAAPPAPPRSCAGPGPLPRHFLSSSILSSPMWKAYGYNSSCLKIMELGGWNARKFICMAGKSDSWSERLFGEYVSFGRTVSPPYGRRNNYSSSGNKNSPLSLSVPGIFFPATQNIYYYIYCETPFPGKDFYYRKSALTPRVETFLQAVLD